MPKSARCKKGRITGSGQASRDAGVEVEVQVQAR
jgi:hypothetical protein